MAAVLAAVEGRSWAAADQRWAKQVVGGLRGVHPGLEALFDDAHARRPAGPQAAAG